MILLGEPKNKDNYILVDFENGKNIHSKGVIPRYKDIKNGGMWFLIEDLKKGGISID